MKHLTGTLLAAALLLVPAVDAEASESRFVLRATATGPSTTTADGRFALRSSSLTGNADRLSRDGRFGLKAAPAGKAVCPEELPPRIFLNGFESS